MPEPPSNDIVALNDPQDALIRFLWCHWDENGDDSPNVVVHQFGFTILYLPVYLVFRDLRAKAISMGGNLIVDYNNSASSDRQTYINLKDGGTNFLVLSNGAYHIGLSEVPPKDETDEEKGRKDDVLETPFIKRVPLWGVSLQNNERVNEVRRSKDLSSSASAYWRFFESKFSLFKAEDFEKCGISIYPPGSTVNRIFGNYLGDGKHALHEAYVGIDNEFDDLFAETVDIALTVHPWNAVKRAAERERKEIDIVFNYLGEPAPFTSLYVRKHNGDGNAAENKINKLVLDTFELLIREKVKELYRAEDKMLEDWAEYYCELIGKHTAKNLCPIHRALSKETWVKDSCTTCREPTKVALQILNDSRIYYYDMKNVNKRQIHENTANELEGGIKQWEITRLLQNLQ